MFYLLLWGSLFILSFFNILMIRSSKLLYWLLIVVITLITALRFGVGTDFFSYQYHYYLTPNNFQDFILYDSYMENGFSLIVYLFRSLDFKFYNFTFFISIFVFIMYSNTIYKNSKKNICSLFLLVSLYWLVYINSALRQGIVMSIFIYAFYEYIENRDRKKYLLIILLTSFIHKVVLIGLIIPMIYQLYKRYFSNIKMNLIFFFISIFLFIIKGDIILINLLAAVNINISYESSNLNVLAILLRIVNLTIIYYLYSASTISKRDNKIKFQVYVYFWAVIIFLSVSNMQLFSRMTDLLMVIEIILIPNLIYNLKKPFDKLIILLGIFFISGILYIKDLNSDLYNGNYYNKGIIDYPYVSILNKEEILKYRIISLGKID